jgi:hypothetical protein
MGYCLSLLRSFTWGRHFLSHTRGGRGSGARGSELTVIGAPPESAIRYTEAELINQFKGGS